MTAWSWPPDVPSAPLAIAASAQSEYWAMPAVAHPLDYEATSTILPARFTLWNIQAPGPAPVAVTPISGIDYLTQPAAGNVRVQANLPGKPSWICFQPRGENVRWFYEQPVTLSGTTGWIIRSRLSTHIKLTSGSNNAACMRFAICKELAGMPQVSVAGAGFQNGIVCGWESDANTQQIEYSTVNAGVPTTLATGIDYDNLLTTDYEIIYVLRAGAGSSTWDIWMRGASLTQWVGAFAAAGLGIGQGDTIRVGWEFLGVDANMPSAPILPADYQRFALGATNFIP